MTDQITNAVTAARRELAAIRATEHRLRSTGHYTAEGLRDVLREPRLKAIKKLDQLHSTYVQPRLDKQIMQAEPELPDVAQHEAAALLKLWQQADSNERGRMRVEAMRDSKLAAVLINSHRRLTGLGKQARQSIASAHCDQRQLAAMEAAQSERSRAEQAYLELQNIAQAVAGGT